jgi:hypothetical protein
MKQIVYSLIIAIVFCSLWLFAGKAHSTAGATPVSIDDALPLSRH